MTAIEPATTAVLLETEAVAYETAALAAVTGPFAAQVAAALASIAAARLVAAAAGTIGRAAVLPVAAAARVAEVAKRELQAIRPAMRLPLERQAAIGIDLGHRHATQAETVLDELVDDVGPDGLHEIDSAPEPDPEPDPEIDADAELPDEPEIDLDALADADPELAEVIDTIDVRAQERLDEAIRLAEALPMSTQGDVDAVTAQANSAVHGARRDTAWTTARAQSVGTLAAAEETGDGGLLWVSERDGCLACLALSGQVAYDGENFPEDTYGDQALNVPPAPYPPRHPHCRCRARPYDGPPPDRDLSAIDPASVLAREARRSVLRGWSAYDSEAARLRAADRLVAAAADLPKTVIDRARRNVIDREFSQDGGRFPQR